MSESNELEDFIKAYGNLEWKTYDRRHGKGISRDFPTSTSPIWNGKNLFDDPEFLAFMDEGNKWEYDGKHFSPSYAGKTVGFKPSNADRKWSGALGYPQQVAMQLQVGPFFEAKLKELQEAASMKAHPYGSIVELDGVHYIMSKDDNGEPDMVKTSNFISGNKDRYTWKSAVYNGQHADLNLSPEEVIKMSESSLMGVKVGEKGRVLYDFMGGRFRPENMKKGTVVSQGKLEEGDEGPFDHVGDTVWQHRGTKDWYAFGDSERQFRKPGQPPRPAGINLSAKKDGNSVYNFNAYVPDGDYAKAVFRWNDEVVDGVTLGDRARAHDHGYVVNHEGDWSFRPPLKDEDGKVIYKEGVPQFSKWEFSTNGLGWYYKDGDWSTGQGWLFTSETGDKADGNWLYYAGDKGTDKRWYAPATPDSETGKLTHAPGNWIFRRPVGQKSGSASYTPGESQWLRPTGGAGTPTTIAESKNNPQDYTKLFTDKEEAAEAEKKITGNQASANEASEEKKEEKVSEDEKVNEDEKADEKADEKTTTPSPETFPEFVGSTGYEAHGEALRQAKDFFLKNHQRAAVHDSNWFSLAWTKAFGFKNNPFAKIHDWLGGNEESDQWKRVDEILDMENEIQAHKERIATAVGHMQAMGAPLVDAGGDVYAQWQHYSQRPLKKATIADVEAGALKYGSEDVAAVGDLIDNPDYNKDLSMYWMTPGADGVLGTPDDEEAVINPSGRLGWWGRHLEGDLMGRLHDSYADRIAALDQVTGLGEDGNPLTIPATDLHVGAGYAEKVGDQIEDPYAGKTRAERQAAINQDQARILGLLHDDPTQTLQGKAKANALNYLYGDDTEEGSYKYLNKQYQDARDYKVDQLREAEELAMLQRLHHGKAFGDALVKTQGNVNDVRKAAMERVGRARIFGGTVPKGDFFAKDYENYVKDHSDLNKGYNERNLGRSAWSRRFSDDTSKDNRSMEEYGRDHYNAHGQSEGRSIGYTGETPTEASIRMDLPNMKIGPDPNAKTATEFTGGLVPDKAQYVMGRLNQLKKKAKPTDNMFMKTGKFAPTTP